MVMPMVGAIQWIDSRAVQAKMNKPIVGPKAAIKAGMRRLSWTGKPWARMRGLR